MDFSRGYFDACGGDNYFWDGITDMSFNSSDWNEKLSYCWLIDYELVAFTSRFPLFCFVLRLSCIPSNFCLIVLNQCKNLTKEVSKMFRQVSICETKWPGVPATPSCASVYQISLEGVHLIRRVYCRSSHHPVLYYTCLA